MKKTLLELKYRHCFLLVLGLCIGVVGILRADGKNMGIHGQEEPIVVDVVFKNHSLEKAFSLIEKQTPLKFSYDSKDLDKSVRITKAFNNEKLTEVLGFIGNQASLDFMRLNNTVNVVKAKFKTKKEEPQVKEERTIFGVVKDTEGITIPGANIVEIGTTNGVAANVDGEFSLTLITANPKILVSFVGYKSLEVEIGASSKYEIVLEEDTEALEEVVVVGFGEQKKVSLVGSQSTVKAGELKLPNRSLTNSLGGRLAGVVSVQRSGEPGYDGADIFIRGIATFGSSPRSPLLIVDGVPDRGINDINPEDIESFTVLKDASATAVYGARGANGVIIINTKSGQPGKPQINVEVNHAVTQFTQLPEFVDAADFMRLYNEGLEVRGRSPQYTEEQILKHISGEDPDLYPNVNWYDELFNKYGYNRSANVNVRGGSDFANYYVSAGYFSETGMLKNDEVQSYNSQLKVDRFNFLTNVDVKVTKTTKLELGINGFIINGNYPGIGTGALFDEATQTPPHVIPTRYSNGQWPQVSGGGNIPNPYKDLTQSGYATEFRNTIRSNIRLRQELDAITEGLSATTMFSFDAYGWNNLNRTRSVQTYIATGRDENGELITQVVSPGSDVLGFNNSRGGNRKFYTETALNYNRSFGKHDVSGLLLYYQSDYVNGDAGDLIASIPFRHRGLSGRGTYGYDERYFIEANFGYSGSENFSPKKRYGFFPSFGTGWLVSNEEFFQPIKNVISHLKFRYTYGLTGNSDTGSRFLFQTRINDLGGGSGYTFGVPGNTRTWEGLEEGQVGSDVTWETGKRHNLGIEISSLDDDLSLIVELFKERRTGILLIQNDIPGASGFTSNIPYGNIGITENKGIDVTLNYNKYFPSSALLDFVSFRGTFNYNQNKNVYDGLPPWQHPWENRVGHRIDQRFGYVALGLFEDEEDIQNSPEQAGDIRPGDIKYQDLNGDGMINSYDQKAIGYGSIPQILYGLNLGVGIKRFEFVVFFQGAGMSDFMYSGGTGTTPFAEGPTRGNLYKKALDRWTPENPNPNAFYPRLSTRQDVTTNYYGSTWWLYRSDYIRLKNAEVAYNFSMKSLEKYGMKNLRVYVNGTNLLTFSPWKIWDPELGDGRGTAYPNTTAINLGVRASFQ
ncbi:TonB-dependent receptor [Echinicola marina]|uniref:SusC/RagA family TonB-linked outer membrane protein n=1 Tax=Echinicola marina TaxID=2859768 RepID=UPI001CF6728E|nr:TonB-dependent receptor [Echinicola marina]UCS95440.1 TonB-dependent receptor [Echinicola marina]